MFQLEVQADVSEQVVKKFSILPKDTNRRTTKQK
jgi:hypothetical protein